MGIAENYGRLRKEIPSHVRILVAAKGRTPQEIAEVIDAGATDIGENYVREAQALYNTFGKMAKNVRWHLIGRLQGNKVNKALPIFDVIQTIDSLELAKAIDQRAEKSGKSIIPVYIEVNVGAEATKSGIQPEYELIECLAREISRLSHLSLEGVMTMGPMLSNPEELRPYFKQTRMIFERIKSLKLPNTNVNILSMGMSDSYNVAIQEGSNMVRLGRVIFGERVL